MQLHETSLQQDIFLFPFFFKKGNVVDVVYLGSIIPVAVQTGNSC